jgi:hypothetical protein
MFKSIIAAISGFFTKELPVVEDAFTKAKNIVNVLKTFLGSATGQTVEAIIELALPGLGASIITELNTFFTDFGIVVAETGKAPEQIAADGLNAISKLTGDSKTLALSNVAAIIGNAGSGAESTLQQAIVALPVVYNPNVLDTPVAPAAQGTTVPPNAQAS